MLAACTALVCLGRVGQRGLLVLDEEPCTPHPSQATAGKQREEEGRTTHFQTRCTLRLGHLHLHLLLLLLLLLLDTRTHPHPHPHSMAHRGSTERVQWLVPAKMSKWPANQTHTFQPQPWVAYVNTWDKTHKRTSPLYTSMNLLTYMRRLLS